MFSNPLLQTTLDPSDFVQELFLIGAEFELVLECISKLQSRLEMQKLAKVIVHNDSLDWERSGEIAFELVENDKYLKGESRILFLVETISYCIAFDRFDLAIQLWNKYEI